MQNTPNNKFAPAVTNYPFLSSFFTLTGNRTIFKIINHFQACLSVQHKLIYPSNYKRLIQGKFHPVDTPVLSPVMKIQIYSSEFFWVLKNYPQGRISWFTELPQCSRYDTFLLFFLEVELPQ